MKPSVLDVLSYALGRRDEQPNIAIAVDLAARPDAAAVQTLVEHLSDPQRGIRNGCIKVLYELASKGSHLSFCILVANIPGTTCQNPSTRAPRHPFIRQSPRQFLLHRFKRITHPGATTVYAYDDLGRVTRITEVQTLLITSPQRQHQQHAGLRLTGSVAITRSLSNKPRAMAYQPQPWDTDHLLFAVREPFPSKASSASLVFGSVTHSQPLALTSQMPENGVIFSDGIEADHVGFNSGITAKISVADRHGRLVV